jgi:L-threonylcarbamoyladenylate synthase
MSDSNTITDWSLSPSITIAKNVIHNGGVIAYPTEAVWGLGCDPFNAEAVFDVLSLKNRSVDKGLILIASQIEQFDFILKDLPESYIKKLRLSWPGPFTWIVPTNEKVPEWVSGKHDGIAIRVTKHPLVCALCDQVGGPIISTSANPQAKPAATSRSQVEKYFRGNPRLQYITKGQIGDSSKPSLIRDIRTDQIIRA